MDVLPIPKPRKSSLPSADLLGSQTALRPNPALPAVMDFMSCESARGLKPSAQHPLAIALSAGADSTALLLAAHSCYPQPDQLLAIHIHHGLQQAADDFESMARRLCLSRGIRFHSVRTPIRVQKGDSVEEQARHGRYLALAQAAKEHQACAVLLAQHADDQVESILLALTRGAGLAGLAGMPARFERHGVVFLRPLLDVQALDLRSYLDEAAIAYAQDPMNASLDLVRGRLRQTMMPVLQQHFPAFRKTFARSAQHIWQAQTLLSEVAQEDLVVLGNPPKIKALQKLSPARMANALRHYIQSTGMRAPQSRQLAALVAQVQVCTTRGHQIKLKIGEGWAQREGAYLRISPVQTPQSVHDRPQGACARDGVGARIAGD